MEREHFNPEDSETKQTLRELLPAEWLADMPPAWQTGVLEKPLPSKKAVDLVLKFKDIVSGIDVKQFLKEDAFDDTIEKFTKTCPQEVEDVLNELEEEDIFLSSHVESIWNQFIFENYQEVYDSIMEERKKGKNL